MNKNSFFDQTTFDDRTNNIKQSLNELSTSEGKHVYVIDGPLGENRYEYDYKDAIIVLIPNHKISFLNFGPQCEEFELYVDDVLDDLGSISDKYRYRQIIGRQRQWKNYAIYEANVDEDFLFEQFLEDTCLVDAREKRNTELLISLLTGSINDVNRVQSEIPDNVLDKIKQKIVLFDADQTRFIYQKASSKKVRIQGLSGTGKTELLLHKLKELYLDSDDTKIFFTCHNHVLAESLRQRIPSFFNFMRVDAQIEWQKRLWCSNAWGSRSTPSSGLYSYICDHYELTFRPYSDGMDFKRACKLALEELKLVNFDEYGYALDFTLIDESQDFSEDFFELCSLATRTNVYIAGDIFQDIFDTNLDGAVNPEFLLNKCYRTDPRTLMFAHAVGMGLFESQRLEWLKEDLWAACGYKILEDTDQIFSLSREPIRRFDDLDFSREPSVEISTVDTSNYQELAEKILQQIKQIKSENPTVIASDIGVIFVSTAKQSYPIADRLGILVQQELGWDVNKAYESKVKNEQALFISNKNNVKGLEFPFVICVTNQFSNSMSYRNSLYMVLTRSFMKTYFFLSDANEPLLVNQISEGLEHINKYGFMKLKPLRPGEIDAMKRNKEIGFSKHALSLEEVVYQLMDEEAIPELWRPNVSKAVIAIHSAGDSDSFVREEIRSSVIFVMSKQQGL